MFVCAETYFGAIFYKSLILCSTDQLTVEVTRNCDMTFFSGKLIYLQEMPFFMYYEICTRLALFEFYRFKS